jgi:hypothetical protein
MRDSFPLQQGVFLSHRQLTPAAGVALSYLHSERSEESLLPLHECARNQKEISQGHRPFEMAALTRRSRT